MNEIEKYISFKGWTFKVKNGEYCLDACPLCDAGAGHFYISQGKEIFYCHKCGDRGHLLSLKKRLGDLPPIAHISEFSKRKVPEKTIDLSVVEKYHKDLQENPAALAYLTQERAFTLETIKKFMLGFNNGAIAIPHIQDGKCLNIKYRRISPNGGDKYFREEGCASIPFNLDGVKDLEWIVLTEGEFDAIALDQMDIPAAAITGGADTFPDEWIDCFEPFGQIYLSFDMDTAGRKAVEKVAEKLGQNRCLNVFLPLKDANDCLRAGYTHSEITEIIHKAKPFESKLIKEAESYFDQIRDLHGGESDTKGIRTGWNEFDNLWGGIRPNELSIWTGETGGGKSTHAANIAYNLANDHHPVLIASFEMKPAMILRKMVQMETGSPLTELRKERLEKALTRISTLPIYFLDAYGQIGLEELKNGIYYARRRYGIELATLDHLHFFLKYSGDHERQAIDQALTNIKGWAMELGIHIILVVHPTKLTYDNKVVHLNDLKGSSGLKQIPDNVLSIWRPRGEDDSKKPTNEIVLYILKVRDDAGDEGKIILTFDKRSQSYSDPAPREASPVERDWQSAYDR